MHWNKNKEQNKCNLGSFLPVVIKNGCVASMMYTKSMKIMPVKE